MKLKTEFAPAERLSENEIMEQEKAITGSPATYFLSILPHPLLIINKYRQMVFFNEAMSQLLAPEIPILGKRPGELFHCAHSTIHKAGCGTSSFCRYCGAIQAILNALDGNPDCQEAQLLQKIGDKTVTLNVMVWTKPFEVKGDSFVLLTLHDISHEKKLRMLEKVFFHDILNTVSGLKGLTEIMNDNDQDKDWILKMVATSTKELEVEIKSHKLLIQAETKELEVNMQTLSAKEVLTAVLNFYRKSSLGSKRLITDDIPEDTSFTSDNLILKRVLGNMVKNALEATKQEGEIKSGFRKNTNGELEFWVWNKNAMPPEVQSHIFKRSFSTKGIDRGIGTYSIKMLTEDYLGGKAWFESSKETGTTFYISLPV